MNHEETNPRCACPACRFYGEGVDPHVAACAASFHEMLEAGRTDSHDDGCLVSDDHDCTCLPVEAPVTFGSYLTQQLPDEELLAECARRGWQVARPGSTGQRSASPDREALNALLDELVFAEPQDRPLIEAAMALVSGACCPSYTVDRAAADAFLVAPALAAFKARRG